MCHPARQRSSVRPDIVPQHSLPCFITPANAARQKPPRQPANSLSQLPQPQTEPSYTSPKPTGQARRSHADNAENSFLGQMHAPSGISPSMKPALKGRKQKRPQWQDVSIDLGAIRAAQEQEAGSMHYDDTPVRPLASHDAAAAAHMSGVSPASPSPPKQPPLTMPLHQHKSHPSVPTLPALVRDAPSPPEALAAWHQNVRLFQQHQGPQQCRQRSSQQGDYSQDSATESLPHPVSPRSQQCRHFQPPTCLPPLHHRPIAHPQGSLTEANSASPTEQIYQSTSTPAMHHRFLPPSCCSPDEAYTHHRSSFHQAVQGSTEAIPSTSHRTMQTSAGLSTDLLPSPLHAAKCHDGFAAPPHQILSEDPRGVQQLPMQYMRHPFGSGSPGGLHRLPRRPSPLAKPQNHSVDSHSAWDAPALAGAAGAALQLSHPRHHDAQKTAEPAMPDWTAQASQHHDSRASVEHEGGNLIVEQQPDSNPGAHRPEHRPAQGQQQVASASEEYQQEYSGVQHQHEPGVHVDASWEAASTAGLPAADMQDVNMRLQQVTPLVQLSMHG